MRQIAHAPWMYSRNADCSLIWECARIGGMKHFHSTPQASSASQGTLPPPQLPIPNAEEVSRFQKLFLARFGVELSEEQAHDQTLRLVQFVFLMQHALPYLQAQKRERGDGEQASPEPSE